MSARIIDIEEFTRIQAEGRASEVWNVLTDEYFAGESIPGTRRVPLDRVGREARDLARDTSIVVYCSGGSCTQSHTAGEKLTELGFTDVLVFDGGLGEWKAAGRPIHREGQQAAV